MAKKRKLRVGLLGAGGISGVHCKAWSNMPQCELVAITDLDARVARQKADKFNIPDVETDAKRLISRKDIDIIDVVVPNRFHKKFTVAALRSGKHVLCEKPMALTAKDVDAMIAASVKAKKKLMCAQHMRFLPPATTLKDHITKSKIGEIYYARAWFNRRRRLPTTRGFLLRENSGGGCCIDVGVHILDLTMHLMDNFKPVSVTGISVTKLAKAKDAWSEWDWGYYDKRRLDVEDFAAGLIRFENGTALSLECSFMLHQAAQAEKRIDLFGTKGGAKWPEGQFFSDTPGEYTNSQLIIPQSGNGYLAEIRGFTDAILKNKPVPVQPIETRAVIAVLEGLYKSQKLGREIKL